MSTDTAELATWQQRMLDRSLDGARARALERSGAFVHATLELIEETGSFDVTVRDVLDRSGGSRRAFYALFSSKDDLLLALVEELVLQLAERLRDEMARGGTPLERLEIYVRSLWAFATTGDAAPVSLVHTLGALHRQLAVSRPRDIARAFESQRQVVVEALTAGRAGAGVRVDIPVEQLADLFVNTTFAAVVAAQVGTSHDDGTADGLWAFCLGALRPPGPEGGRG